MTVGRPVLDGSAGAIPSRTLAVLGAIKHAILAGELRPGQSLVETDLAQVLGVSKTPVREALKTLAGAGLVTMSPYRGAAVRTVDDDLARSVYDMRLLLEPEAVRRSVARTAQVATTTPAYAGTAEAGTPAHATAAIAPVALPPPDRDPDRAPAAPAAPAATPAPWHAARQALARSAAATDPAERSLANRDFHRELYASCGNALLIKVLDDLRDQTALVSAAAWRQAPTWEREAAEHRGVLAAAEAGDAERAASLLRSHIESFFAEFFRMARFLPEEPR
jgi:DNA-binding GntR family transcriptional regulator